MMKRNITANAGMHTSKNMELNVISTNKKIYLFSPNPGELSGKSLHLPSKILRYIKLEFNKKKRIWDYNRKKIKFKNLRTRRSKQWLKQPSKIIPRVLVVQLVVNF